MGLTTNPVYCGLDGLAAGCGAMTAVELVSGTGCRTHCGEEPIGSDVTNRRPRCNITPADDQVKEFAETCRDPDITAAED